MGTVRGEYVQEEISETRWRDAWGNSVISPVFPNFNHCESLSLSYKSVRIDGNLLRGFNHLDVVTTLPVHSPCLVGRINGSISNLFCTL